MSGSNLHGTEILTRGLCFAWLVGYLKLRISYGCELPIWPLCILNFEINGLIVW